MQVFGRHDDNTIEQMREVEQHAERVALMADGHLGYSMPIGGVAAFDHKVSVTGVGFDIACGNCAVQTDYRAEDFTRRDLLDLGHTIQQSIAFGVGRSNQHDDAPTNHKLFSDARWRIIPTEYRSRLKDKAREQLGSVGSGNHYVDVFVDGEGFVWVGVHFGSRGLGHTIASNFIAISQGGNWGDRGKEDMALLSLDTPAGNDYWNLMELAGDYAYAGRDWVCDTVAAEIGGEIVDRVHNNHNFAWVENHEDIGRVVVVRKGATPAWPGQRGFVGGSMGDDAVILHGAETGSPDTFVTMMSSMFSTVHGAGRVMSRSQATGKTRRGKVRSEPGVDVNETREWIKRRDVFVFGADLDEAPQAYRRLDDVLTEQGNTVVVEHRLRPVVVVMASSDFDDAGAPANPFLSAAS